MKDSDFPEFDAAYNRMLLPDNPDRFDILAVEANFSIYHNDLWRGTARRFAELIVRECAKACDDVSKDSFGDWRGGAWECETAILERFGVEK